MSAAAGGLLHRRGAALCCLHRDLCRVVWRSQTALFSSKSSDKKQPRRTHIKKAKLQPPIDVNKLVEKLFSLKRSDAAPPAVSKARLAKAALKPSSSSSSSSSSVTTSSLPPAVAAFDAAPSFKPAPPAPASLSSSPSPGPSSPAVLQTESESQNLPGAPQTAVPPASGTPAQEPQTFPKTTETKAGSSSPSSPSSSSSSSATTVESSEQTIESALESRLAPEEALQTRSLVSDGLVEPVHAAVEVVQEEPPIEPPVESFSTSVGPAGGADEGLRRISHITKEEAGVEPPVEAKSVSTEAPQSAAAPIEDPVKPMIDAPVDHGAQTSGSMEVSHRSNQEPSTNSQTEPLVESGLPLGEPSQADSSVVGGPVESTIDITVDNTPQQGLTQSADAVVEVSLAPAVEDSSETRIEAQVESGPLQVEPPQAEALVVGGPVESTIDITVDQTPLDMQVKLPDTVAHDAEAKEFFTTVTVESPVEPSRPLTEPLQAEASISGGPVESSPLQVEPLQAEARVVGGPVESSPLQVEPLQAEALVVGGPVESSPLQVEPLQAEALVVGGPVESTTDVTIAEVLAEQTNPTNVPDSAVEDPVIETTRELVVEPGLSEVPVESAVEDKQAEILIRVESSSGIEGSAAVDEEMKESDKLTLESVTLHQVKVFVESLETDELLRTKVQLDQRAALVEAAGPETAAENLTGAEEGELLTQVLSQWESLSEDLDQLEGDGGTLVHELLSSVPTVLQTSNAAPGDPGEEGAAMTLEALTLAEVKKEVESLESEVLLETSSSLEKEAEDWVREKKEEEERKKVEEVEMKEVEEVEIFVDTTNEEMLTLDIGEATEAIEAETSIMMEAMFGSEQGPKQPVQDPAPQGEPIGPGPGGEAAMEAASLEAVTLAEVEASLWTLDECLSETADRLERESENFLDETKTSGEEEAARGGASGGPSHDPLTQAEIETRPEGPTEELLLLNVPGNAAVGTGDQNAPEGTTKEDEDDGMHAELDPVQRVFLQKMREYNEMLRSGGRLLEAEPDYNKRLSEETAKLQKLFGGGGGGDLENFPHFTFPEPKVDQDSS